MFRWKEQSFDKKGIWKIAPVYWEKCFSESYFPSLAYAYTWLGLLVTDRQKHTCTRTLYLNILTALDYREIILVYWDGKYDSEQHFSDWLSAFLSHLFSDTTLVLHTSVFLLHHLDASLLVNPDILYYCSHYTGASEKKNPHFCLCVNLLCDLIDFHSLGEYSWFAETVNLNFAL